ncbi:unnamed protein product [Blepharisma stoltei]|uniref:Uncharacterized protein n=1 Tax=Blepharisma stoltei TaxID=1481888 RepID=A0AAU9J6W2_9CILI|nr:unnamed protein product [Blepharisma stoltei]
MHGYNNKMSEWKAQFCDCTQALPACCISCHSTAIMQGITAYEMGKGNGCSECCLVYCLGCIGAAMNRNAVRAKYGLSGNCCLDCLLYCIGCGVCMATQEFREVYQRNNGL